MSSHFFLTFLYFVIYKFQYAIFQLLYDIKLAYTHHHCVNFAEKNVKTLKSKHLHVLFNCI